jgi:hypothetical protein
MAVQALLARARTWWPGCPPSFERMRQIIDEYLGEALLRGELQPEDLPAGEAARCIQWALRRRRMRKYAEALAARRQQLWRIALLGYNQLADFCARFDVPIVDIVIVVGAILVAIFLLWRAGREIKPAGRVTTVLAGVRSHWWRWWRLIAHCAILFCLLRL